MASHIPDTIFEAWNVNMPCHLHEPSQMHKVCLTNETVVYADRCLATSSRLGMRYVYAVVIL